VFNKIKKRHVPAEQRC